MQLKHERKNEQRVRGYEQNDETKNKPYQEATQSKAGSLTKEKYRRYKEAISGMKKRVTTTHTADTKKKEYSKQLFANTSEILGENG